MEKQLFLTDFTPKKVTTPHGRVSPATVLDYLEQGISAREIGRRIGRTHRIVLKILEKLREKGLVLHGKRCWLVNYRLVTPEGRVRLADTGVCEAHHVKAWARVKRKGDWVKVAQMCKGGVGNWVWKRAGVTFVLHKRVLSVSVACVPGETVKEIEKRAELVVLPSLRLFERETGFLFRGLEWRGGFHWAFNKRVSKPFLEVAPELADSSHPDQVEVRSQGEQERIRGLITGSLEGRLTSAIQKIGELELVVRAQVRLMEKIVIGFERLGGKHD